MKKVDGLGTAAVAEYYDTVAAEWDLTVGPLSHNPTFARRFASEIGLLLEPVRGAAVALELGAGTGAYVPITAPYFQKLIASDLSDRMLDIFKKKLAKLSIDNVSLQRLDALDLRDIESGSLDVIYSIGLLENLPDFDKHFSECARVLKPGGSLLGITSNGDCPWYALRWRLQGGSRHERRRDLANTSALAATAQATGFEQFSARTWGAVPPGVQSRAITRVLSAAERILERTFARKWLGLLSYAAKKT